MDKKLVILGGGNIGMAIARGLVRSGGWQAADIIITRRGAAARQAIADEGFTAVATSAEALPGAGMVLLCVQPAQCPDLLDELAPLLQPGQTLVSVVTGLSIAAMKARVGERPVVRAMPNTAITLGESMTCIAVDAADRQAVEPVLALFNSLGSTRLINEDLMSQATALCACGVAFFLRAIRAASQGGIEIGFHAEEAIAMAAQTARGAASLLLVPGAHPESEIDRVTTPMGCTIAGLNLMEHEGFSSAMIKGIVGSSRKADSLGAKKAD
jgi:pyrroline-5-carboxylate reductase